MTCSATRTGNGRPFAAARACWLCAARPPARSLHSCPGPSSPRRIHGLALGGQNEGGRTMSADPLLDDLKARAARDQGEGHIAYFHALLLQLKYSRKWHLPALSRALLEGAIRLAQPLKQGYHRADRGAPGAASSQILVCRQRAQHGTKPR